MSDEFSIDHEGINGRWRVYYVGDDGYGREMLFDSRSAAENWVLEIEAIGDE